MATSLLTSIELNDSPAISSGTKRAKIKRLFSTLGGGVSTALSENQPLGDETPPTPDQFSGLSPTKQAIKKMRFFFARHWLGTADPMDNNEFVSNSANVSVEDFSCYNKYKTDGMELERLFNEAVVDKRPPSTRDEIVRKMGPFESMDFWQSKNWMQGIRDFNVTFSPVESEPSADLSMSSDAFKKPSNNSDDDLKGTALSSSKAPYLDKLASGSANGNSYVYDFGNSSALPDLIYGLETAPTQSGAGSSAKQVKSLQLIEENDGLALLTSGRSLKNGAKIFNSNSPESNQLESADCAVSQKVMIPTFREEIGMEVHSIANNLQGGTITEADLIKLACCKKRTFMDANFYNDEDDDEERSISSLEEYHMAENFSIRSKGFVQTGSMEHDQERERNLANMEVEKGDKGDTVKFNKFSYLVIYDASKKCHYSESTDKLTLKIPHDGGSQTRAKIAVSALVNTETSLNIEAESTPYSDSMRLKSILKRRTNEQESIEAQRARKCDEIDASDFLEFVENHENKRRSGEDILVLARERQLKNYYDDQMLQTITVRKEKQSFSGFEDEYNKVSGLTSC